MAWLREMYLHNADDPELAALWLDGRDDEHRAVQQKRRRSAILAAGGEIT